MCPSSNAWGTPDFGQMLNRSRVVQRIAQSGDKPCILFGPSGCGKSVAAAQYSLDSERRAVWVDAGGGFLSARQLAQTTLRALGAGKPSQIDGRYSDRLTMVDLVDVVVRSIQSGNHVMAGLLVVADDLGAPPNLQAVLDMRVFARGLWRCGSRMLITCRELADWPSEVLRECALVGQIELALTSDEARAYLERNGPLSLVDQSAEIRTACAGHPAFFAVMASQATDNGLAVGVARTPSLEAWLRSTVLEGLSPEERYALLAATLLRTGDDCDLAVLEVQNPVATLECLANKIPLAGCARTKDGGRSFRIHQLVDGFLVDAGREGVLNPDPSLMAAAVEILSVRRDYPRAAELLGREGRVEAAVSWLVRFGEGALADGHYESLNRLICAIPVAALMARPQLLLIWGEVCAETGRLEDAFAKCRAARTLAEHESDSQIAYHALALCARYAGRANRLDEAEELAREILCAPPLLVDEVVRAEALLCRAQNAVMRGEFALGEELLHEAISLASSSPVGNQMTRSANQALSLIPALSKGDYLASSRMLAPAIVEGQQYLTDRVMLKGNVATCLCEAGRLPRCEQLLRSALSESHMAGLDVYSGAYEAVMGCAKAGRGDTALGIELIRHGIASSLRGGDEQGADQSRVCLAIVLRASGEPNESLVVAERAYERLTVADTCRFRQLAALEVAASLLALGDSSAAASWAGAVADEGFDGNRYHALRTAMILAEVDRRQGRLEEGVERIRQESDYVLSENPNWQVAMYCRAFPGLLGIITLAIDPGMLPAHLLSMIPAEHAEQILVETAPFIGTQRWRELGERLIGEPEMGRYLARNGLPQCHVRLLGGLEVSIGGRSVRERDWRKRKARLLFAMLATRQGRDVPRDQVVDHLWPEMDEDRARNNFYVAWSTMKSVLGGASEKGKPSPYVECVGGVCRTVRDTVRSDIDEFEEALFAAREAESDARPKDALSAYECVANLYRGDLLPGDVYDDWFSSRRDHYRAEFVDAMLRASQLLIDAADPGNALMYLRRAIHSDPVREDLYQRALRCQIAVGQRSSAIDTYRQCRGKLSEELGLDPSGETRQLYDQILAMEDRPVAIPFDPLS